MKTLGRHWLAEYYGCSTIVGDEQAVREVLLEAARRSRATIVTDIFHRFNPHGVSGVIVIAESHLAIHTWPEHHCASVDIFSCGAGMQPELAIEYLHLALGAKEMTCQQIIRGIVEKTQDMEIGSTVPYLG